MIEANLKQQKVKNASKSRLPAEMGVRELFTTTLTTSSMGIVRLLRVGGVGFVDGL